MMEGSIHLVARQTVEVLGKDRFQCEALAAQTNRAAAILAAAVERGLDRVDTPGERLRIGRIEIDLGICDPAHWEESLAEGIRSRLPEVVMEALRHCTAARSDPAEAAILLLGEFARSGRLPWWCSASDSPQGAVLTLLSEGCRPEAVRAILRRPQAIGRLTNQLTVRELLSLIALARPELGRNAQALLGALAEASGAEPRAAAEAVALPPRLWRAALEEAAAPRPRNPLSPQDERDSASESGNHASAQLAAYKEAVARRLGRTIEVGRPKRESSDGGHALHTSRPPGPKISSKDASALARAVGTRLSVAGAEAPVAAAMASWIARIAGRLDERSLGAAKKVVENDQGPTDLDALVALLVKAGAVSAAEAAEWSEAVIGARSAAREEEHDSVAVPTSGLVIAWPFLPAFFDGLEMLEEGCFRDIAARHRAAAMLHYLATGEECCPEQDLPLAKILSGLDLETVHDPGEPLGQFEIGSADALVDAILRHAPMLGKINRAGFRETFVIRPGALATRDGHWLLQVEQRSADVLLDRLPWTFSWIQLPWMEVPLQVEW